MTDQRERPATPHDDPVARARHLAPDVDDLLAQGTPDYDWLVDGLIERGDRIIVTGPEGGGKSTFLAQCSMQIASGIHPVTLKPIDARRVLYIDCENGRTYVIRRLAALRKLAGDQYHYDHLRVLSLPNGTNLLDADIAGRFVRLVDIIDPDLLVIGPIYKLAAGDPNEEQHARAVARVLDHARGASARSLMCEAHTPYGGNNAARPRRPYGASLWSRWPEFGVYLAADGTIDHWRGQREERVWPARFNRGTSWPWVAVEDGAPVPWSGPLNCIAAVVALLDELGDPGLTANQIVARLREHGVKYRRQTVYDACIQGERDGDLAVDMTDRRQHGGLVYRLPTAAIAAPLDDDVF